MSYEREKCKRKSFKKNYNFQAIAIPALERIDSGLKREDYEGE